MAKLSKAKRELLENSGEYCFSQYRPAMSLVRDGLAVWKKADDRGGWLIATDAGREALKASQENG